MLKMLRESEINTCWNEINHKYEKYVIEYINRTMNDGEFRLLYYQFFRSCNLDGMVISAMQTALKLTVPGIPDNYQASELRNNHFTDPDNREIPDFQELSGKLEKIMAIKSIEDINDMEDFIISGKLKLFVNYTILNFRKKHANLFYVNYNKIKADGEYSEDIIAFSRSYGRETIIVVVFRNTFSHLKEIISNDFGFYGNTVIIPELSGSFKNLITGRIVEIAGTIKIADIFDKVPFAVLYGVNDKDE